MPTAHLICGSTGAGKTTYAKALAHRVRGVCFSIDEWMATLFLGDRSEPLSLAWAIERISRCELQMWRVADQLLVRGIDVVLDVGLSKRQHRDRFRERCSSVGAAPKLHYLDVDAQTRRERVRRRNENRTETYPFEVTDDMFEFMETWFEPPGDDELYGAMIICT
jgi:predicted kinase